MNWGNSKTKLASCGNASTFVVDLNIIFSQLITKTFTITPLSLRFISQLLSFAYFLLQTSSFMQKKDRKQISPFPIYNKV